VPEAWVVDLQHDQLLVFSEPDNEQYRQQRVVERAQLMTLAAMPGLEVDLSALFQH